jgi:hypothetical protein
MPESRHADGATREDGATSKGDERDQPRGQGTTSGLSLERRRDLHRSGITDQVIDRVDDPDGGSRPITDDVGGQGWRLPWSDGLPMGNGKPGMNLLVYDRDKRPGNNGRAMKVDWPTGQTSILGCIRFVPGSTRDVLVEGQRQALAVASYAPDDVSVWCMNGDHGVHAKIKDRLTRFSGHQVTVMVDGDWRRNDQVGKAVLESVPNVLTDIGASEILVADVGGIGTDGIDDIIGRTVPEHRAALLAKILDGARPVRDRRLEQETERQLMLLQAREQAQKVFLAKTMGEPPDPSGTLLGDLLAEPDDAPVYRVTGLWPTGGNVILSAQRKAGKTTLRDNLIRCLVDGCNFLARPNAFADPDEVSFAVTPLQDGQRVYVADLELDRRTLRRWLAAHRIQHPDRVMVQSFRGRLGSFDVLDDKRRDRWAVYLSDHGVVVLIIDPLAALLDAYGFEENSKTEVGRVLVALDQLKADAGISELMIVHHMGHGPERSRGTSRLRDWPDAEWFLVREHGDRNGEPPPDAARFFSAEGRDVAVRESKLAYDQATRRLSLAGGNRVQHAATKDGPAVLKVVRTNPGRSQTDIVDLVVAMSGIKRDPARAALRKLITDGQVTTKPGPKRATLHYPAETQGDQP